MNFLNKLHSPLTNLASKLRPNTTEDLIQNINENPSPFAFCNNGTCSFKWPRKEELETVLEMGAPLPDITFKLGGDQVAYIKGMYVKYKSEPLTLEVGHFATEKEFQRQGIGRALANWLFQEVSKRYGIQRISFSEYSPEYASKYPPFFQSLGAVPVSKSGQKVPDWYWDYSSFSDL